MERFEFDEKTMIRAYSFVTNKREIKDKLAERGYDNCILIDHEIPSEEDIRKIQSVDVRGLNFLMYLSSVEQHKELVLLYKHYELPKIDVYSNQFKENYEDILRDMERSELLAPCISLGSFIEIVDIILRWLDAWAEAKCWIYHTDYDGRCGNCHEELGENDKYCTECGTKRGEGEFKPYFNAWGDVLYGCPSLLKWKCSGCGEEWTAIRFVGKSFCPKCGKMNEEYEILEEDALHLFDGLGHWEDDEDDEEF